MVDILPRGPTLAEILGGGLSQGFSQGVSSGLDLLAKERIERLKEARGLKQTQSILSILGINPEGQQATESAQEPQDEILPSLQQSEPSPQFSRDEQIRIALAAQAGPNEAAKAVADIKKEKADAAFKERQLLQTKEQSALQDTRELRTELRTEYKEAQKGLAELENLEQALNSGKVIPAGIYNVAQLIPGFGDLAKLWSTETQIVDATGHSLVGRAARHYKGTLNKNEFESIISQIVNLKKTVQGNKYIIDTIKYGDYIPSILRKKAADEIISESIKEGKPIPIDLDAQIDKRVEPEIKKLKPKLDKSLQKASSYLERQSKGTKKEQKGASEQKLPQPPPGEVLVRHKATGQIGSIPEEQLTLEEAKDYEVL